MRNSSYVLSALLFLIYHGSAIQAQPAFDTAKLLTPGPANQDTTKFATIYVVRPFNEIDATWWNGFFIDKNLMVRVSNQQRYIIKCAKTGKTEVWSENEKRSSLFIDIEAGKKYYVRMEMEPGTKHGYPRLVLLNDKDGPSEFEKVNRAPLYIYDPDPLSIKPPLSKELSSYYVWTTNDRTGFYHMQFNTPLSMRHYFASPLIGFRFNYYNTMASLTFSEAAEVQWLTDKNFDSEDEFRNFIEKQKTQMRKGLKKTETLQELTDDSLTSSAELTSSVYLVTQDTKPAVSVNGVYPTLEIREYHAWMYKSKLKGNKGIVHSVLFSERGLPEELHTKEEIRWKIQQFMNSCQFGEFRQ